MKRTTTLIATMLLAQFAALQGAELPAAKPATSGEFVTLHPACTGITHDSPNPTVLGCGLARMKDGAVLTVYSTPAGAYSKPGTTWIAGRVTKDGGKWLAASRRFGLLDLFASDDDMFTWHHATTLDIKPVSSAHLLKLSDGRVLLTYGNRAQGSYGIEARTTSDGGRTWGKPQQLVPLEKSDCGYPDAVELPGGRLIVAYYADRTTQHQRYHMGVINLAIGELH